MNYTAKVSGKALPSYITLDSDKRLFTVDTTGLVPTTVKITLRGEAELASMETSFRISFIDILGPDPIPDVFTSSLEDCQ